MSRDDPQMKIRLPAELKACIEAAAATNRRTLNAEIVARLVESFEPSFRSRFDWRDPAAETHARLIALDGPAAVEHALISMKEQMDALQHVARELPSLADEIRRILASSEVESKKTE
ncbi:Arc family DNA-binding protein [Diaphorobacter sp.]|uniref:Arc family DNA-binding protein n=1 Tax=Diaphorobacter sp. TaxID=1934310 RepID=UPI003D0C9352